MTNHVENKQKIYANISYIWLLVFSEAQSSRFDNKENVYSGLFEFLINLIMVDI